MRILLIDQYGEIGGAQRGLLEAAAGFAARGWQLDAAAPDGPLLEKLRPLALSVTPLPCGPFRAGKKTAIDALRFGAQFAPQAACIGRLAQGADVLYVNGPRVLPAAAWARGSRHIVFHAHSVVTQKSARAVLGRALQSSGARVLASSHFVARWLRPYAPDTRVIYNGIAAVAERFEPRTRFRRIGLLGRIAPEKGQLTFVRAAARCPELEFAIAGAPVIARRDYFEQVRAEAAGRVRFLDWMDDVSGFFREIDLLVVPSDQHDANPRVIPEAFSAGVPVLAFDSGGIPELIEHRITGWLTSSRDPESLAEAIQDALRAPELLNAMAVRAHARWRERYTLERFQSEVCEAILSARASAAA
jgi:glycosyltransferase involved in cell wall biosynthesis